MSQQSANVANRRIRAGSTKVATGSTISAGLLTSRDRQVLELCESISRAVTSLIHDDNQNKSFMKEYGKISYTRDGGSGRGGGKLQRDALCTRGIQGKAPFSNRNLRWHPLIAADSEVSYAKKVEEIQIEGETPSESLVFKVRPSVGQAKMFRSDQIHDLSQRHVVLPSHWNPHINVLRSWNDTQWTQNSCIITAYEASDWQDAVESYAVLAISVAVNFYAVNFNAVLNTVCKTLRTQSIDRTISIPSNRFPLNEINIVACPLCLVPVRETPSRLPERKRSTRWKPEWSSNKRGDGDEGSMQLTHVFPLIESEMRHHAGNVRYGHRWCNVAMTDHSVAETVDFMEYIVKAHGRCKS